ncbi:MAG: EscC/YscC/HrcC family type III secretion system outer membrane ring protein [Deltaproteobacteria bacterium]|nr:EscC/YscC/HrcC family type III secretion system outer membrane ring protein [Deltaproteobacteria bacterium]
MSNRRLFTRSQARPTRRATTVIFFALLILASAAAAGNAGAAPLLTAVRHHSVPTHTRVVLDVSAPVEHAVTLDEKPGTRRLRVTLRGTGLAPNVPASRTVGDGILSTVHALASPQGVVIDLDLQAPARHHVFALTDPDRVVVDLFTASAQPTSRPTSRPAVDAGAGFSTPHAPPRLAAPPTPAGFSKNFTYYADQQDLPTVLMHFARVQGLSASISTGVTGKISGRFDDVPADKFLRGMRAAFGVSWYRIGSSIHFFNDAELTRAFITPKALSADKLFTLLHQSAVFSPQLPPTLAPDGNMIVVSGPPQYLEQVMSAATAYEETQRDTIVMRVFPLKYAWAEDISVNSMDKTVTIPGIASILRAMIGGTPTSATRVVQQKATVDKLTGTGLAALGQDTEEAAPTTEPATAGPPASIMADPRVNAVLVHDAEYRMPYYAKVIEDLDKPVELVEIHAAIVDIDTDYKRELGITYQAADPSGKGWGFGGEVSTTAGEFSPLPGLGVSTGAGLSLSTIYTMGSDYFLARVQALEEEGEARMLGRPSVLTVDNIQATLENTTTYYIPIQGNEASDLFKVEAGTVLRVTPHIIENEAGQNTIKLVVSVQDDQNDNGAATTAAAGTIPPIKQTKINTQAIVGAGQSLLIGGYYYEQKGTDESGIPILKDIPGLGNLFKTSSKSNKRMERLILITPRVIDLTDLPPIPDRVDDPAMRQSPTQADFSQRPQRPTHGGCAHARAGSQKTPAATTETGMEPAP